MDPETEKKILSCHGKMNTKSIAKVFDLSVSTISIIMQKHGKKRVYKSYSAGSLNKYQSPMKKHLKTNHLNTKQKNQVLASINKQLVKVIRNQAVKIGMLTSQIHELEDKNQSK